MTFVKRRKPPPKIETPADIAFWLPKKQRSKVKATTSESRKAQKAD
jgi:hypothetical protein